MHPPPGDKTDSLHWHRTFYVTSGAQQNTYLKAQLGALSLEGGIKDRDLGWSHTSIA